MAGLDHRTVWRFTGSVLGQGFLHARCCATCVLGPDSVLHSGVSAVAVHHGRRCCFHAVFPFIVGRPVLPSVYTAWTIAESAVLGQVVLARRCTTPGAVYVRAVRSVARGDTIGAVLGLGLGHYDRCRGLDSAQLQILFKIVDFLIVALRQFPLSW